MEIGTMDLQTLANRPVFICGHPKSGTTLIRALMDDHPELVVFPEETSFFRTVMPILGHRVVKTRTMLLLRQFILRSFPEVPQPEHLQKEAEAVSEMARPEFYALMRMHQQAEEIGEVIGSRHFGDGLASVVMAFGQVYGKLNEGSKYWVEKTPHNEQFADQIFEWWPEARCIHVVRDPRDNYASYRTKRSFQLPLSRFTEEWQASVRTARQNQQKYGQEAYLMFNYEDLLRDPDEGLGRISEFLGIEDDPVLRVPSTGGEPWEGNSMFGDTFSSISTAPIGRYLENLENRDIRAIETVLRKEMLWMGYPPEGGASIFAWLRMMAGRLRFRMARAWRNLTMSVPERIKE
jgi:hypothetical protein